MALKGNLRDFTITQLLNLINLAQKSGSLIIEGPNESAQVAFREGKLAYARMGTDDNSLSAILHNAHVISDAQYGTLQKRAGNMGDKELGLLLINAGYVTQEDIIASLQSHFADIIHKLFTWAEGFFHFEADEMVPPDKIPVRLELENIIIEGSRRINEWEQLSDEIPNLEMALQFTERPGVNMRNVNLSVQEWKVVSYINPKNSINQISKATKMNEMEIRRIVYGLLQAGLVELVRPGGIKETLPGVKESIPGETQEEKKNFVNRIVGRIRSL
ncbi:MAG: DUF4388 domain-containing protein [Chloroflexi bacterium]|nr:DUF4388 domain-containing protein [Chloroflexota bacterium]